MTDLDLTPTRAPDDDDWRRYYSDVRELPSGELAGLSRMMFTTGLVVGLCDTGYRGRYCYEHLIDAAKALESWDGDDEPPGPWIKYKGRDGERNGPGSTE